MENQLLKPELFNEINENLGGALTVLESNNTVLGRDNELNLLRVVLNKMERPVALLLGGQGTGKSVLVRAYMNHLKAEGHHVEVFQLKVGVMGDNNDLLKARMNSLLEELKRYKEEAHKADPNAKIILFIDEVHTVVSVFGKGSKIGGDLLKESLAESEKFIEVVTATTAKEYRDYIAGDLALDRRLNRITINETTPSLTFNILKDWLIGKTKERGKDYKSMISDDMLKRIISTNRIYNAQQHEPAKSIDVLSTLISYSEVNNVEPSEEALTDVLKTQFNIQMGFEIDEDEVIETFKKTIKGQPLATAEYERIVNQIAFNLYPDEDKPRGSILSVGPTGTGKTASCKALAQGMHGDPNKYLHVSMTDYSDRDGATRLLKRIGDAVDENPNLILLLDELEKADERAINILLPLLDEGLVRYETLGQDGTVTEHKKKLSNAIIIATANAGAELLEEIQNADDEEYIGEELTKELQIKSRDMVEQVEKTIGEHILKPELVGRFDSVIPFRKLEDDTLLGIATRQLEELLQRIYDVKGIHIKLPPDKDWSATSRDHYSNAVSMYIVKERMGNPTNAGAKSARQIKKIIEQDIQSEIIATLKKYRGTGITRFEIDTDGESYFENRDITEARGMIQVKPAVLV